MIKVHANICSAQLCFHLLVIYSWILCDSSSIVCQNIILKCAWGAGIAVRQVVTVFIVNDENDKHDKT